MFRKVNSFDKYLNKYVEDPEEGCDDGNTDTEECAYGLDTCTVCAADCTEQPGDTDLCGDGVVDAEEGCDDGNTDTEECAYGIDACTVCAADCTELGASSGKPVQLAPCPDAD